MTRKSLSAFALFLGDIAAFYIALLAALLVDSPDSALANFGQHFLPFSLILIIWLLVFYISELYDFRHFKNIVDLSKLFAVVLLTCIGLAVAFFYLTANFFNISPKTNLLIFIFVFGILSLYIRFLASRNLKKHKTKTFFIRPEKETVQLIEYLKHHTQLGHEPVVVTEISQLKENLANLTMNQSGAIVVLPAHLLVNEEITKLIYENLRENIDVVTPEELYEAIFKKLPTSELNEAWFLKNVARPKTYAKIKYFIEPIVAIFLFAILLPLLILIAVLIKLTSVGPIIYSQKRVGRSDQIFVLYKFRTMMKNAEKEGPRWAEANDTRATQIGRILRHTHLDELPQLVNIIRGNLSFIGPRPERPEFVEELKKQIPFYGIRHIPKPGIAGWAQLNYRYGASVGDAEKKLEYDLFYLKNNSFILDFIIVLKTIKRLFVKA